MHRSGLADSAAGKARRDMRTTPRYSPTSTTELDSFLLGIPPDIVRKGEEHHSTSALVDYVLVMFLFKHASNWRPIQYRGGPTTPPSRRIAGAMNRRGFLRLSAGAVLL